MSGDIKRKKTKGRDWNKIIMKHLMAWFVLILFANLLWSMIKPVLPEGIDIASKSTPTSSITASTSIPSAVKNANPVVSTSTTTEPFVKPFARPASATTTTITTTTVTVKVKGEKTLNAGEIMRKGRVEITVNGLNVRLAPDKGSAIIGGLRKGAVVQVHEVNGKWLRIKTENDLFGYISEDAYYMKIPHP